MKKNLFLRGICLLSLLFLIISCFSTTASASSFENGIPDLSGASNVYFSNLESGRVLVRKNPNKKIAPASTVKIMTGLLALEHFEGKTDTVIEVTETMLAYSEGTSMKLVAGDRIRVYDLVLGVVCGGYNDAAYVLAHAVAGSSKNFITMMNERAAELGMLSTNYVNPTGWDDEGMYTTLSDTAFLAKAAMENQLYMELSSTVVAQVKFQNQKQDFTLHNRNALIGSYYASGYTSKYADGMIAGMTDNGGYCVVTKFTVRDTSYLCVVMGADERDDVINSFYIANELIDYARKNLGFISVMPEGERICEIPVDFALFESSEENVEHEVKACIGAEAKAFLPLDVNVAEEITYRYYLYSDRLTAPLEDGERVGGVDFYYNGEIIATVPLVVCDDVTVNSFVVGIEDLKSKILGRASVISLVSFAVLSSIWFYFFDYKKRRKKTKKIKFRNY